MEVALWNWHTPYAHLLARALPEHRFLVQPTPYAPHGWLPEQRPRPSNAVLGEDPRAADLVVYQTGADLQRRGDWRTSDGPAPALFVAHNHAALEAPAGLPALLDDEGVPLVCISAMKARSWKDAGYARPIAVIPPGIPAEDYAKGEGGGGFFLTVCNNLRRPLFDLDGWLRATAGTPVTLVGDGNAGIRGAIGPAPSWAYLNYLYARAQVYLNPTCPPYEDSYNLASLEAAASGCPVVNLHGAHPPIEQFPFDAFASAWRAAIQNAERGNRGVH